MKIKTTLFVFVVLYTVSKCILINSLLSKNVYLNNQLTTTKTNNNIFVSLLLQQTLWDNYVVLFMQINLPLEIKKIIS